MQDEEPLLGSSGPAEESEEQAAAAEAAARPIAEQHEETLNQQGLERYATDHRGPTSHSLVSLLTVPAA